MKSPIVIVIALFATISVSAQKYEGSKHPLTPEQKLNDEYCSGLFHSTDGTILDVVNNPSAQTYLNILDWLPGRVAGLQVYQTRTGISVPLIRGNVPAVFVDEIQVNLSYLEALNANDIAIIKVIKTPFYGGFNGGNGAIAIYTLGGEEEEEETMSR
jgi:hypothetical protein